MPTTEQLLEIWDAELHNPWMRRTDDPLYQSPEQFIQNQKQMKDNNNPSGVESSEEPLYSAHNTIQSIDLILDFDDLTEKQRLRDIQKAVSQYWDYLKQKPEESERAELKTRYYLGIHDMTTWSVKLIAGTHDTVEQVVASKEFLEKQFGAKNKDYGIVSIQRFDEPNKLTLVK